MPGRGEGHSESQLGQAGKGGVKGRKESWQADWGDSRQVRKPGLANRAKANAGQAQEAWRAWAAAAGGGEWPGLGGQSPANSISEQAGHLQVSFGLASGSRIRDCPRQRSGLSGPAKSRSPSAATRGGRS